MKIRVFHLVFIVLISAFVGYYLGISKISFDWKNYKPNLVIINKEPPASQQTVDFSLFWNVLEKLENTYYDKKIIDPQKLLEGAITGMVQSLGDPYTVYLPPNQNNDFKQGLAGTFSGIGAELGMRGKQIIVVAPLDGTPAKTAGIKAGDAILKVDGKDTVGWTLSQAVDKIRGPKGTKVVLLVLHKDEDKSTEISVIRETITVKSVDGWIRNIKCQMSNVKCQILKDDQSCEDCKKIVYIRLSQFGDNTNTEWLAFVNKLSLQIKEDQDIKGLVLDLRNNPGGYLTDATFIASEFLKEGIVVIQDKAEGGKTTFSVSRRGLLTEVPLVVLINKGSASASEIVAGALQDHKRAKLVGETSFGKGTIQQAEELGGGAGLHVTIAKWLTPNGTWVNSKGLTPDVLVENDKNDSSHDVQLEKAVEELLK